MSERLNQSRCRHQSRSAAPLGLQCALPRTSKAVLVEAKVIFCLAGVPLSGHLQEEEKKKEGSDEREKSQQGRTAGATTITRACSPVQLVLVRTIQRRPGSSGCGHP